MLRMALSCLCLASSLASAPDPSSAQRFFQRGVEKEKSAQYSPAATFYEAALLVDPRHAKAWLGLGNCRYRLGEKAKALEAYERSLALDPGNQALKAFVAKLKPAQAPAASPTPPPAVAEGPFFRKPAWDLEKLPDREAAWGRFRLGRPHLFSAIKLMLEAQGIAVSMQDRARGTIDSGPVLINLGEIEGDGYYPGNDHAYRMRATLHEEAGATFVEWELFRFIDPEEGKRRDGAGSGEGDMMAPPPASSIAEGRRELLERAKGWAASSGAVESVKWGRGQEKKLQVDMSYRLWKEVQPKAQKPAASQTPSAGQFLWDEFLGTEIPSVENPIPEERKYGYFRKSPRDVTSAAKFVLKQLGSEPKELADGSLQSAPFLKKGGVLYGVTAAFKEVDKKGTISWSAFQEGSEGERAKLGAAMARQLDAGMNFRVACALDSVDDGGGLVVKGWAGDGFYNLYVSEKSGSGYRKANEFPFTGPTYTVRNVVSGKAYYFCLTMVKGKVESRPSAEFSLTAP